MADDFEFRAFMLQVSQRMTSNDFGQLKYLLKGYVSNAKCEEIKTVHDYFEELERMCLLGPKKFDVLKRALVSMGRQDLVEDVEQKEHYFARLFREKTGESLEQKEYDAVCDGTAEAAEELKPLPRSGQNAPELQEKLKLASLENGDKAQLEEISDMLGITYMSTAMTDLRKENKEVKKGDDLPLKKDKWSMQSKRPVEMRAGGGDEEEKVKPTPQMGNAESMEIPLEDTAPSNSNESAMEAEDHELESKTTEQALASVEKITLSTPNEKEPVEDTVLDELEDLNTTKDQVKHGMTEATIGAASSPQLGDEVVTDGKENDKDITADSKKDEIKSTSNEVKHQGPQHPHGPGARPKEPLFKKAKTAGLSGADKQMATEQADEVSETKPHGTLFVGPLHPEKTGSKVPTEDEDSDTWSPTGKISSCGGNESESTEDESTESEQPKRPTHGPGQGASAAASKGPHLCNHPPGVFSTPPDQNVSGYSGHPIAGNYSFPELIVGESAMDGQGQGACAAPSTQPLGCHHPPGVFSSKPTNQKASGYSDHAIPDNVSPFDLIQFASGLGLNVESSALQQPSYQLELLKQLVALQTGVSYAQGSSTYNAAAADSPVRSNCYSKAGYSVVITNGDLCESTCEKGVFVMESGRQFSILIANSNNYAAEVDIMFGGMWLGVWVVEAKQSLSTPLVIEGSSWAPGRLKFFSASDERKPQPSKDIYGDEPALNGKIELEFKPESKMLKVLAKHVRREELFEISIIETKTTTVGDLKQEIRKKWNSDILCLFKGEEVLQEGKTISSYTLNENEVIGVLNVEEELMIESSGMDPIIMMVDPRNVSVEAVKHFIEKKFRIPADKQILRFKGEDACTEVDSESLAQMLLKSKQSPVLKVDKDRIINIMVPDREGKENKVEINWSATVDDLKEKLEERDICDIDAKLTFGDKEISRQGDKKLIDLGFRNQSKISQTRSSTLRGFSGRTFDGSRGSNLRGFGGFGVFDDFSSSSTLRGFTKGTRAFRSGPEDAEDYSSECGKEGFAVLHGSEKNVHKNFQIDKSGQKFSKEGAVTLVIQLIANSMGAAGAGAAGAAAAAASSSVPPGAYYSGGPTGPMSTPTPPPVPD